MSLYLHVKERNKKNCDRYDETSKTLDRTKDIVEVDYMVEVILYNFSDL